MEDPRELLRSILDLAGGHPGVHAVVQTGSRARGDRVDRYSDLDIELIGPGTGELVGQEGWLRSIEPTLVALHLANEAEDAPDWPTCLAVFEGGRKVDFTLAGTERLTRMVREGLDPLYRRGYRVLLDPYGLARGLPEPVPGPPPWHPPTAGEFRDGQTTFWFEATQVPVYLARRDLWHAQLRLAEMREQLLTLLEWNARARSSGAVDTWHLGHHVDSWTPAAYREALPSVFPGYHRDEMSDALRAATGLYATVAEETAHLLDLPLLPLHAPVSRHVRRVLGEA
ncbi:aminoglycoside 6-adenylyltransferase [Streptomyces sp. NPDC005438]|uniref:aminoglycoside 6-adenylyltransferase n=1 Tax=Streptomyces sp. NPDC005438 TaxID=3156880 RepID=UPI0033A7CD70